MVNIDAPGIVLFDMDSTLITIECIDELAALVGQKEQVSAVTEAAMRGELDFAASLRARVALLQGVNEQQLQQLLAPIPFSPGAEALVHWFHRRGWHAAVVSGGFTWFSEKIAAALQLDAHKANELQWRDQLLTGHVIEPVVDAESKADYLRTLATQWQIPMANTIAVGDGANDRAMLQAAGMGVAYCAKPALREVADFCIEQPDLMQLADYLAALNETN